MFAGEFQRLAPMVQWASPAAGTSVVPGATVTLAWNVTGLASPLDYETVYGIPAIGDWILVVDGLQPSVRSLTWQVPVTISSCPYRFRVYLQAPKLMAGSDRGWASYADSFPVQVGQ